jgi:cobalamin biosynthesis protein CobT
MSWPTDVKNEKLGKANRGNSPLGKANHTVTKTTSQPDPKGTLKHEMSEEMASGDYTPKTPSGMLSGLRGVLADHAANSSSSKSIGQGGYGKKVQSEHTSVESGSEKYPWPTGSDTTVSSDSDNENYGSQSSNNIKKHKRE